MTFQELATKEHDMEATMASYDGNLYDSTESKNDKIEFNVVLSKSMSKEAMSASTSEPI